MMDEIITAPTPRIIGDGFTDIPAGRIATVVTHLQMLVRSPLRTEVSGETYALRHVEQPQLDWYRRLYLQVGGHDWLWFSRLQMSDAELTAALHQSQVEVFALENDIGEIGLLELDFRVPDICELAFFGVVQEFIGTGAGRFLMNRAIERAFSRSIKRLHVHTCTLDHPSALGFYIRSGFTPYRQQIEIAQDPRLTGVLPRTAAPHIPILEHESRH